MKKLSIEQKAKAYDEAIERAKGVIEQNPLMEYLKKGIEYIFPELKESDDEKIRKGIIDFLWKEKIFLQEAHSSVENNPKYRFVMDAIAWLEKQGEQKLPIEKLPEEMKTIGESLGFTTQEECDEYNQMVSNLIMSDDNKSEQKPAWNNKEKLMLNDIIEATERSNIFMEDYQRELIDWLKSLKERVQPQYLTITNEELVQAKKEAYNEALDKIEYHSGEPTFDDGWSAAIWYLKKKNAMPQTQWKPSDEQMEALDDAISSRDIKYDVLSELWKDLKKLKG